MPEPESYDLWLLRAQREDQTPADQEATRRACLAAIGALLRVDAQGAQQILTQLPRLLARNVRAQSAHKLVDQLARTGAVAHLSPVGQTPRFDDIAKQAQAAAKPRKAKPHDATPARKANDVLVDAARVAHDAAMAHFPADDTSIDFSARSSATPPPVPRPIRHSATRVAATLAAALVMLGAAGSWYWVHVARAELELAESTSAPPPDLAPTPARAAAPSTMPSEDPARTALLGALAERASQPAFSELANKLASAVERKPQALRIEGQVVGAFIDVRTTTVRAKLDELADMARSGGALVFVNARNVQFGTDRLALLPSADIAALPIVFGTSGPDTSASVISAWMLALANERPYRVTAFGSDFAEGRYDAPTNDAETLAKPVYDCPGQRAAPGRGGAAAQSMGALDSQHRGERFSCAWRTR